MLDNALAGGVGSNDRARARRVRIAYRMGPGGRRAARGRLADGDAGARPGFCGARRGDRAVHIGFDPGRQDPRGTLLRRFVITNPASGRTDVRWSIRRPTSRTTGRRSTARCIASPSPRAVWSLTPPPSSRASRPRARAVAKRCAASNATSPAASGVCCSHTPTSAHPLPHRRPRSPSTATSPTAASP